MEVRYNLGYILYAETGTGLYDVVPFIKAWKDPLHQCKKIATYSIGLIIDPDDETDGSMLSNAVTILLDIAPLNCLAIQLRIDYTILGLQSDYDLFDKIDWVVLDSAFCERQMLTLLRIIRIIPSTPPFTTWDVDLESRLSHYLPCFAKTG